MDITRYLPAPIKYQQHNQIEHGTFADILPLEATYGLLKAQVRERFANDSIYQVLKYRI